MFAPDMPVNELWLRRVFDQVAQNQPALGYRHVNDVRGV